MAQRSRRLPAALCVLTLAALATPARAVTPPTFGPLHEVATLQLGGAVLELAKGDFTGDGREDVVVTRGHWASPAAYPISILVNNGHGGFSDQAPALFGGVVPTAVWPRQTLIADFNEDGRPDIFIGDSGMDVDPFPGHTNHLLLSASDGRYADASANLPQTAAYFHSGAAGDVNGDGHVDLVLADLLQSPVPVLRLLLNDGTGHFTEVTGHFPDAFESYPRWFTRSALVDVNGDGALDLVLLGSNSDPTSSVLLNDGHGYFTELPDALPPKPFGSDAIGIVIQPLDLNGDAHPDLLLGYTKSTYKGRWIQVAINDGHGTFHDETAARLPQQDNDLDWPYDIVLGDINGDGATDFGVDLGANFCCSYRRVVPPFYLNRGDGTFESLPSTAFAQNPYGQFRLMSVNDDGALDVFSAWEAGPEDAPEHYAVQYQGEAATGPGGPGAEPVKLTNLRARTLTFRVGTALPHFSRRVPTGTTFSFSIDRAARVKFAFARVVSGRRSGGRCVRRRPALEHNRRCTLRYRAGALAFDAAAGFHRLSFSGRVAPRKTLRPGRYEVSVTAVADGISSGPETLNLQLLPPRR